MLKIYFAASIRGGGDDMHIYAQLIQYMQQSAQVLTEHIGNMELLQAQREKFTHDEEIYRDDIRMIDEADLVIAEVTQASLGVGYELGYAQAHQKPVYCLYRTSPEKRLSAMIR